MFGRKARRITELEIRIQAMVEVDAKMFEINFDALELCHNERQEMLVKIKDIAQKSNKKTARKLKKIFKHYKRGGDII